MTQVVKYPKYMYHRDYPEPRRVDNKAQEQEQKNLGWTARYLFKEYPKMVNGIIIKSAEDEKLLIAAAAAQPKVIIERGDEIKPVVLKPPIKGSIQVPGDGLENSRPDPEGEKPTGSDLPQFEMLSPDGAVIPDLAYATWPEAQAAQKDLNANVPGHKARKIAG